MTLSTSLAWIQELVGYEVLTHLEKSVENSGDVANRIMSGKAFQNETKRGTATQSRVPLPLVTQVSDFV